MDNIFSVPNQKIITINKDTSPEKGAYTKVNVRANSKARQALKPSTYKVYTFLCENRDGYTFALSCSTAMEECAVSANTFHTAINEMIKLGYIKHRGKNLYTFVDDIPIPSLDGDY